MQQWEVCFLIGGHRYTYIVQALSQSKAIEEAKTSKDKPTLIQVKTTIGKYSVNEGTNKVHGSPLEKSDITQIKEKLGMRDIPFQVSQQSCDEFKYIIEKRCKFVLLIKIKFIDILIFLNILSFFKNAAL